MSEEHSIRRPLRRGARAIRDPEHQHLDQFGAVLVLAIATIAGMTMFDLYGEEISDGSVIAATILSVTVGVTMILALRASGVRARARRFANAFLVLASVTSVIAMIVTLTTDSEIEEWSSNRPSVIWVVISMLAPVYVVRRLLKHRRVTVKTMLGAISAYLMIAIGYTYLFLYVADLSSEPFFSSSSEETSTAFSYFSLTTITTLGYGDLSPATNLGRLLATSEAIIGQVYLVTFVAMFVGLFIAQRQTGADQPVPEPTDSSD